MSEIAPDLLSFHLTWISKSSKTGQETNLSKVDSTLIHKIYDGNEDAESINQLMAIKMLLGIKKLHHITSDV